MFTVLADSVRVETTAVMSNTTSERRQGYSIYYSYFEQTILVIPARAEGLTIPAVERVRETQDRDLT